MRKQTTLWKCKDGTRIRVCDMTDKHLANTIALLERNAMDRDSIFARLPNPFHGKLLDFLQKRDVEGLKKLSIEFVWLFPEQETEVPVDSEWTVLSVSDWSTFWRVYDIREEAIVVRIFKIMLDFNVIITWPIKKMFIMDLELVGWSKERIKEMEGWANSKWQKKNWITDMLLSKGLKVHKEVFIQ